ncbi:MAG: DNA-directed RNA polymerase subunit beta [Deltaproteobacteria bacterium]|nr:MAG: DNA-directed RNA polymerase subunit beta [Deltaproteobacteria bacterium]
MAELLANNFRFRRTYAKSLPAVEVDNLIRIQRDSYEKFLQSSVPAPDREPIGLQGVFKSVFPIQDFSHRASLQFVGYDLETPKYDVEECRERGMTYSAPLKVTVRLVVWDVDTETDTRTVSNIKEQEVYFGEIPLMTENGTFIVNGTERVVVSQLHRSPGIFFDANKSKSAGSSKTIFSARIIPNRGSWIDFEFDSKDILYVRIDRRRKLPATVLLRALGYSTEELLNYFYQREKYIFDGDRWYKETTEELLKIQQATVDVVDDEGNVLCRKGRKFLKPALRKMKKAGILKPVVREIDGEEVEVNVATIPIADDAVLGRVSAYDIVDMETGEILVECNEEITEENLELLLERGVTEFEALYIDNVIVGSFLRDTLLVDKIHTTEEAVIEIYRRLRPGEPPTYDAALNHFENLFFNAERYDLSKVGRLKLNHKLGLDLPLEQTTLTREDIRRVVQYLIDLKNNKGQVDDIDHLGNRRVRAVGELLENQYRIGLVRMEKAIKERMSLSEIEALMPHDLINAKPVSAVIKEFFGSSQLSQFMDQTNPLSEVTHKRRLSALGPGGLTRERAGFEVRDVHPTHYGRICPIETPEGPNIGLIASLSTYARVNEYGFIETPYRKVENGKACSEVTYYTALEEERHVIAQANARLDAEGNFLDEMVIARRQGEFALVPREEITLMDVSPNQLVSVAASLVPFLENDDANRALMGANMMRQAVPLVRTEAPLVGTGMERVVARDSGVTMTARRAGVVESVDATRIVVKTTESDANDDIGGDVDIYNLTKFVRSNQSTCINQKPVVRPGDRVEVGDIIADGPATEQGELALGQNAVVAFMPWQGYNFEDSILISERLVREDYFTSIHIEEFEVAARDTKLGKEEITRDIPNVGEEALKNLDESGIVRIGAPVRSGDILVGKITPKGETQLSPEEKLLRAIFGEKAGDVKDTSLRVPPGVEGVVMGAQVFSREGVEKDQRSLEIEAQAVQRIDRDRDEKIRTIRESAFRQLVRLLDGRKAGARIIHDETGEEILARGETFTEEKLRALPFEQYEKITIEDGEDLEEQVWNLVDRVREKEDQIRERFAAKVERHKKGDELAPGVIKLVKVFVAIKRKLQPGDKMAGRHGNKGVISKVLPMEDMPYLEDGTPVDVVLNPLGVPSRMNVGQILETHLGWALRGVGRKLGAMVDGMLEVTEKEMRDYLMEVFGDQPEVQSFLADASFEELKTFARKYRDGVTASTPVFAGASESEIKRFLGLADLDADGQSILYDGRTGEAFENRVTVGVMYVLKLHHLVDEKIHARSIGPYSLVTQQPLGGKAQFGGQRLGEMEVWALEAYGAAYSLQEFLTVKSDDVAGRTRMYESIVKGENILEAGLPESFNVLVKELQALALDVELLEDREALRNK